MLLDVGVVLVILLGDSDTAESALLACARSFCIDTDSPVPFGWAKVCVAGSTTALPTLPYSSLTLDGVDMLDRWRQRSDQKKQQITLLQVFFV